MTRYAVITGICLLAATVVSAKRLQNHVYRIICPKRSALGCPRRSLIASSD